MALPREHPNSGDARAALERIRDALEDAGCNPQGRGDHLDSSCPAHDDTKPSLSVDWRDGAVYLMCHGGCDSGDVVDALRMTWADLYDVPKRPRSDWPTVRPTRSASASRKRRTPATQRPAKPADPADPYADARRWPIIERYPYVDEQGTILGWVCRKEHPERDHSDPTDNRKTFVWARPGQGNRVVFKSPERRPLYCLPDVLAAVADGRPVWVVEGEKDADAITAAGACGTTHPGGATKIKPDGTLAHKWLPEHTETLRGAHVVIVADRDADKNGRNVGYVHAAVVAAELDGVAASVRVVAAAAGKDASDHLAAGRSLEEFEEIPAAELAAHLAPAPPALPDADAPDAPAADPPDAGDADVIDFPRRGGGGDEPPLEVAGIARDEYRATDNALIKIPAPREGKTPAKTGRRRALEVINVRARLLRRIRRDMGTDLPPVITHVDLEARRDDDRHELTAVTWDDFEAVKWVASLPWADVTFKRTPQGRSDVVNAIAATSENVDTITAYGALGWRQLGDGGPWVYIHAAGAIGADGEAAGVRVDVDPEVKRFALPAPPDLADVDTIRQAVHASVIQLDMLPPHMGAPLLGASCRAILGDTITSVFVRGTRGTGKSSLSANVTQHYCPSARHDDMPFQAGEDYGTLPGLEEIRHTVGDMVTPLEDLAPDRGAERAAQRANLLLRSQYNRAGKVRARKEGGLRPTLRPRGLQLLTGEDGARGSAETRTVYISVARGELSAETLLAVGADHLADRRATLTAAMARYLAPKMPLRPWVDAKRKELALAMRDPNAEEPGVDARRCDLLADLGVGVVAMLDMATTTGALTAEEAADIWARTWAGLLESKSAQAAAIDARTMPRRSADLLRSALVRGHVHIRNREHGIPDDAQRWGWEVPNNNVARLTGVELEARPSGDCVGWTDGETLWLDKGAAFAAMERQGRGESDPLGVTPRALAQELADAGLLTTRRQKTQRHNDCLRMINGKQILVWELPVSWLWPAEGTDPDDTERPAPPALPDVPPVDAGTTDAPPAQDVPPAEQDVPTAGQDVPSGAQTSPQTRQDVPETSTAPAPSQAPTEPHTPEQEGAPVTRQPARPAPRFPAMAAVVCDDLTGAWLTGAETVDDPSRLRHVDMPNMTNLPELAAWADGLGLGFAHAHTRPDDGQIWITAGAAGALGLPDTAPEDKASARLIAPLKAAGWNVRHTEAWITLWRPGARSIRLAVVPWMAPVRIPLIDGDPDPLALAVRLAYYAHHVGLPLRMSAGVTGVDLMERLRPPGSRLGLAEAVPAPKPATRRTLESAYLWQRQPVPAERSMTYVHAYDKNAQYLAACSSVVLGLGAPQHVTDAPAFSPKVPGLWRVAWDDLAWQDATLPDPFDPSSKGRKGADDWFATPTLAYALEIGRTFTVLEAYLYPENGRALEPWYRQLRGAREALTELKDDPDIGPVLAALKATYAAGLGRLDAETAKGDPRYRPDWYAAVRSTARANLTRNVLKVVDVDHRYPLAVIKDQVLYASDDPDPVTACPSALRLGDGLGQWKVYGTTSMEQAAARLTHTGRPAGRGGVMELFHTDPGQE